MLLLLHVATWWDFGSNLSRSMLLAHMGLFLIWQPLWRRDQKLDPRETIFSLLLILAFVIWLSSWSLFIWNILLIGLVGGRTFLNRNERWTYMLTLVYLFSGILIANVPQVFGVSIKLSGITPLFQYGSILIPLMIAFIPADKESDRHSTSVDLFRAVIVALITAMLGVGSLLNMYHSGVAYPVALFQSLIVLSSFLLMISWLLSPNTGFSGLAQLWDRSLLNIGTPFEQWLAELANLSAQQQMPEEFLEAAMDALVDLPWIVGVKWQIGDKSGMSGVEDGSAMSLSENVISVTIYTHRPGSSILLLHCNLLIQLLEHFYLSKLREQELAQRTHLQAIHETGARVTHDIKNLLQSLHTITLAIKRDNPENSISGERRKGSDQLLRRQLPHLTQRLQLALDKLQAPEKTVAEAGRLNAWWQALQSRNSHRAIKFTAQLKGNPNIPTDLFDSVLENLLENVHNKRQLEPHLLTQVKLICDNNWIVLTVCDDGSPVNAQTAIGLFQHAVDSDSGLGIGLYQAGKQAEMCGYKLDLMHNIQGNVCFRLMSQGPTNQDDPQISLFNHNPD